MPTQETGKQRAARIPLDYFQRHNPLELWKTRLAVTAFVVSVLWWGSGWILADRGRFRYSRGPVADVHAIWDTECTACHEPFHRIDGKSWAAGLLGTGDASDQHCKACHAGPAHNSVMSEHETASCAGCHREHGGREASLVRMPDQLCTRCHNDVEAHLDPNPPRRPFGFANRVTRFDRLNHAEFRMLRARLDQPLVDPAKLRFSHKLHLTPGLVVLDAGEPAKPLRLSDIQDQADRARYRRPEQDDTGLVRLDCGSCHQLDSSDFGLDESHRHSGGVTATRDSGRYMLPIRYKNQCRACHPLTFDRELPWWTDRDPANAQPKLVAIPHALQPDAVRSLLAKHYAAQFLRENPHIDQQPVGGQRIPGAESAPDEQTVRRYIDEKIRIAEKVLYAGKTTCGECHFYEAPPGQLAPVRIIPPDVPEIWFQHAKFDHAAHRALTCSACHKGADSSEDKDNESRSILIPERETCERCHGPSSTSGGPVHGGARFECTECHLYHNRDARDQWLTGVGSRSRDAAVEFDVDNFLHVTPRSSAPKSQPNPRY